MASWKLARTACAVAVVLLSACAPGPPGSPQTSAPYASSAPKRITAAIMADPPALVQDLTGFGLRGTDAVEELVLAGLTTDDNRASLRPVLGDAVPSVDNGRWVVHGDGRMEISWQIREGARWHDGTPLTADDLVFAARVSQDKDIPEFGDQAFSFVDSVEAVDARTVRVTWKSPYIEADRLFGTRAPASPMPKHILEKPYLESKAGFTQLGHWSDEFVGTGPFRVREFARGSHLLLEANEQYVLGRPRIDILDIRFIPDPTTIVANILAGAVELTLGKTLSVEQAIEVRNQWRDGRVEVSPSNALSIYSQFLNPNPVVVTDLQFRRALLHAIDRQALVDSLLGGLSTVAHSFMFPGQEQYLEIEGRLTRYEYDSRRAGQMIEGLGYSRAADGFFRDTSNQPLAVELRTYTVDINQKATLAVADSWQRVGVRVEPLVMSPQATQNNEYVFTYPAFLLQRYTSDVSGLKNLYSARAPRPENNFRSGNVSRYANAEFDALLDRFFLTIPAADRIQVLGQILRHVADNLTQMGLFFDAEPTMMANQIVNVAARWPSSTQAWNAHEWDKE